MASGSYAGAPTNASYLDMDLVDSRRAPLNEVERMSMFQDRRGIEGDLATKHLYGYWGFLKKERLDDTDLKPRVSIRGAMKAPFASPQWFAEERQLQKDSIATSRGPRSHGGDAVAKRFAAGHSLHDAQAMEGEYHSSGRPMRLTGDQFAYAGPRSRDSMGHPLMEAVLGGGGLATNARHMLSHERGSMGMSGDMVRDSLPFRAGPIRMLHGDALASMPANGIHPEQNPTAFALDKHSFHSYKRGLPTVCENDSVPSKGHWDAAGYL